MPRPDATNSIWVDFLGAEIKLLAETGFWALWKKPKEFNEAVRQFIMGKQIT